MTQKQRNVSTNGFVYSDGIMDILESYYFFSFFYVKCRGTGNREKIHVTSLPNGLFKGHYAETRLDKRHIST